MTKRRSFPLIFPRLQARFKYMHVQVGLLSNVSRWTDFVLVYSAADAQIHRAFILLHKFRSVHVRRQNRQSKESKECGL